MVLTFTIIIVLSAAYIFFIKPGDSNDNPVTDFESCAASGQPILESYPEQCISKDGQHFTRQLSDEEKKNLLPPSQ